jgi:hypothetical protein
MSVLSLQPALPKLGYGVGHGLCEILENLVWRRDWFGGVVQNPVYLVEARRQAGDLPQFDLISFREEIATTRIVPDRPLVDIRLKVTEPGRESDRGLVSARQCEREAPDQILRMNPVASR